MANTLGKAKKQRGKSNNVNNHKKSVAEIIENIITNADILLEVLDARFIEKTRQPELEKKIIELGKILIYVLNKSDLVSQSKLSQNADIENLKPKVIFSARKRRGTVALKSLIKKEAKKIKSDAVNVGIIGYPNVGKSSLSNILTGRSSAKVSPESGYTKAIQKIRLSKGIYLIDTPGIILDDTNPMMSIYHARHSQISAVTWDKTRNPEMVVARIMREYPGALENFYNIDSKGDSENLIESAGRKFHFLKKGNAVDEMKTAKKILRDWQEGKIDF